MHIIDNTDTTHQIILSQACLDMMRHPSTQRHYAADLKIDYRCVSENLSIRVIDTARSEVFDLCVFYQDRCVFHLVSLHNTEFIRFYMEDGDWEQIVLRNAKVGGDLTSANQPHNACTDGLAFCDEANQGVTKTQTHTINW